MKILSYFLLQIIWLKWGWRSSFGCALRSTMTFSLLRVLDLHFRFDLFSHFIRWKSANVQWKVIHTASEGWLIVSFEGTMQTCETLHAIESALEILEDPSEGERERRRRFTPADTPGAAHCLQCCQEVGACPSISFTSFPMYHATITCCYHHAKWSFVLTLYP